MRSRDHRRKAGEVSILVLQTRIMYFVRTQVEKSEWIDQSKVLTLARAPIRASDTVNWRQGFLHVHHVSACVWGCNSLGSFKAWGERHDRFVPSDFKLWMDHSATLGSYRFIGICVGSFFRHMQLQCGPLGFGKQSWVSSAPITQRWELKVHSRMKTWILGKWMGWAARSDFHWCGSFWWIKPDEYSLCRPCRSDIGSFRYRSPGPAEVVALE